MAFHAHYPFNESKTWLRGQQIRWFVVCLVLLQWCCTKYDVKLCYPDDNTSDGVLLSVERNYFSINLFNQCRLRPETEPETTKVKEKTMSIMRNFGILQLQSDKSNATTNLKLKGCGQTVDNLPKGIFFKIPQHIHTRDTLIEMYTDVCFKYHKSNKRLFNINKTTDASFVDIEKPLIGFVDTLDSEISISGRSILIAALILVMFVCVVIFKSSYTKKRGILFDQDIAISTASKTNKDNIKKQTRFRFLNDFYNIPRVTVYIYPFSINQYANDVVKEQKTAEELMKYEWSRYLSFKNFPLDCPMMPLRLSQAGFYYTGQDQEVKCFSCGMINHDWSADETAVEVHKRLSPSCQFIRGENTDNVEIHTKDYYNGMFDTASPNGDSDQTQSGAASRTSHTGDSNLSPSTSTSGANGGPFDALSRTQRERNNTTSNQSTNQSNKNGTNDNTASPTSQPDRKRQSHQAATNTVSGLSPKHPQYTELAARVGSFLGWTLLDIQDPVELAQAGFFYTGVKDFVRCYYCGVGLKNWERGDNPWTEHSRWSHGCGHVLSSRAAGGSGSNMTTGRNDSVPTPPAGNQESNGPMPEHGGSDKNAGASGSSDMDSAAVRSLMDMGYTHEQVQTVVRKYRAQNASKPLTAVALVELLEEDQSFEEAASIPPHSQTTGNASTTDHAPGNPSSTASTTDHAPGNPSSTDQSQSSSNPSSIVDQTTIGQSDVSTKKGSERSTPGNNDDTMNHSSNTEGAKSLLEENRELKSRIQCKICLDRNANMIFLPCGHMVACQTCAVPLRKCAICRKLIKGSVRVYQS